MGEIPVNGELALKLLAAASWYDHGDRECSECSHYIYLDDIQEVIGKVQFRFEHFMYGDGSVEQGGQGIRVVMIPKVPPEELPETRLDEDETNEGVDLDGEREYVLEQLAPYLGDLTDAQAKHVGVLLERLQG